MLVSLVILAAAALVWALAIGERLAITTAGALFVVVGYVLTNEFWQLSLGPVSLNAGRALLLGACLMFAVRVARGVIRVKAIEPLDLLVALLTGYLCLRFATTTPADVNASSVSPLWRLLACFIMPATLYFLVANDRLNPRHWKSALLLMTMLGVYLGFTAVAEITTQWWAVFPRYISDPTLGTHFGRARGPALNSASLGICLTVCFWAAWMLLLESGRRWRIPLAGALGLMGLGVLLTFTRSTWIGLAGTLLVIPAITLPVPWRRLLLTGGVFAAVCGAVLLKSDLLDIGRHDSDGDPRHSVYQRASFFYVSMAMFRDAPIFGCGFGRFYDAKLAYLADRSHQIELESIRPLDHHNTLLSILTETGFVGLALFLGVLAGILRASVALLRDARAPRWARLQGVFGLAALLTYCASALFHDLSLSPSEQWMLFLAAGMTVAAHRTVVRSTATENASECSPCSALAAPIPG